MNLTIRGIDGQIGHGDTFAERTKRLDAAPREQQAEAAKLDVAIAGRLKELEYGG
jgi:hypothetical protein